MKTDTSNTTEIYIFLPDEAVDTWRPTQAVPLGNDLYRILATDDYDPEYEVWEFLPGSVVRGVQKALYEGTFLVAVKAES